MKLPLWLAGELKTLSLENPLTLAGKYQHALGSSGMGLWELNQQQKTVILDQGLATVFEIENSNESIKLPLNDWYKRIHSDDLVAFRSIVEMNSTSPVPENIFIRLITKSTNAKFIKITAHQIKDSSGQSNLIFGICQDVSVQAQHYNALAESKVFFERVMDALPDPIFVKDKEYRCLFGNAEFEKLIGKTRAEFLGKKDEDFLPAEMADVCFQKDLEAFTSNQGNENEEKIPGPNGQMRFILTKKTPFQLSKEQTILIGIIRDITEKNKFDSQFRLMISLIDSSGDLFGFTDNLGVTVYVNKAGRENLGIQVGKKHFAEYLTPNDRKLFVDTILPNLRNTDGWQGEMVILNPLNGEEIPIWLHIFCVKTRADSDEVFYAYTGSDLRKLIKIQNSLIGQSKMAALGEMAAEIAHEINNPLAIIQGKSQLMLERMAAGPIDKEKLARDLELIERNSLRIQKIINSSKALARKSEKDPYEHFSILKIVEESFEICKERFQKQHFELMIDIQNQVDYTDLVEARNTEIIQVLVNLLNNSFDAIKESKTGWAKLILSKGQTQYQIEVIDSGNKIPKDIADKMMAPFFTTKPTGHGTGLGLSLSKQIADAHGGQFYYDPKSSNTRFVLCLQRTSKST